MRSPVGAGQLAGLPFRLSCYMRESKAKSRVFYLASRIFVKLNKAFKIDTEEGWDVSGS